MVKGCKVFVSSTAPPEPGGVKGVHASLALWNIQGHFALLGVGVGGQPQTNDSDDQQSWKQISNVIKKS